MLPSYFLRGRRGDVGRPSISQHNSEDSRELQQTLPTAADAADRSHTLQNHHSEVSELSSYRSRSLAVFVLHHVIMTIKLYAHSSGEPHSSSLFPRSNS